MNPILGTFLVGETDVPIVSICFICFSDYGCRSHTSGTLNKRGLLYSFSAVAEKQASLTAKGRAGQRKAEE